MNTVLHKPGFIGAALLALITLAGCATTPSSNPAVTNLRTNLTTLQADPILAPRAPVAINEAEEAVKAAEAADNRQQTDLEHRIYIADRKISTARARAESRLSEDQMAELADQRNQIQLAARTREAAAARSDADSQRLLASQAVQVAQQQQQAAAQARQQALSAGQEADAARQKADMAMLETQEYRRQISDLQAQKTDRGLVITLGDILFATAQANLKPGSQTRLDKLAAFLNKYPEQTALIEGHTDSVGSEEYNLGLSQRRADEVRAYLIRQGIAPERVRAVGKGKGLPVASNKEAAGRQQNRRVEIILQNMHEG